MFWVGALLRAICWVMFLKHCVAMLLTATGCGLLTGLECRSEVLVGIDLDWRLHHHVLLLAVPCSLRDGEVIGRWMDADHYCSGLLRLAKDNDVALQGQKYSEEKQPCCDLRLGHSPRTHRV